MTQFPRIHATAEVSDRAAIGDGSQVWHNAQIREGAILGANCIVGKGVYIDFDVRIGDAVKIQNRASIYHGTTIENGVFVGPHVVFTNDMRPRAINPDGTPKGQEDWVVGETVVRAGASIGASSVILPGITIGLFALIGAGTVVTRNVPDHGLVVGNPGRLIGYVCACAGRLRVDGDRAVCGECGRDYAVDRRDEGGRILHLVEAEG